MKRFISVILILAMVFAAFPAMIVSADDTSATMEMSGVRVQYPTFTSSGGLVGTFANPSAINYENSGGRIQWFDYTGTYGGTVPSWNGQTARFMLKNGEYAAYKIRIPAEGCYEATLKYMVQVGGTTADMYLLPGNIKKEDIDNAVKNATPFIEDVDFLYSNHPGASAGNVLTYETSFDAKTAGEYLVVWMSKGVGSVRPQNLILNGCTDGEEKDGLVGEITLSDTELLVGENATVTPKFYNGYTGAIISEGISYSSSDISVLSVNGTTITANKPGKATLYAEVAGYDNKVALDVKVYAANMSGVRAQYPLVEGMYGNKDVVKPNNITYAISGHRIDWFDYTGTYGGTTPSWNSQTARFMLRPDQYAAYKINVPANGFYNVKLEYLVSNGDNSKADMYLLPGNTKKEDIATALGNTSPVIRDVDFLYSNHEGASAGDILTYETSFDAKTAGEYLVVWKSNRIGAVRPKNLILNGCTDGEEKDGLVGEITLSDTELVVGESAMLTASLNDAYTGEMITGAITYSSSDSEVLSVDKTTVTANKAGTATLYAEVAGYPNKVALDVTVASANAPTELTEDVNFASGAAIEYKIGDGEYTSLSANNVKSIPVGTEITVKANDADNFAGWVRGTKDSKNWISDESEYTFTIMSHTYLTPVYTETKETDSEQVVEFWNENKEYLGSADVVEGKATAPVATLTGHNFIAWHISETDILPLENGSVHVSGIADAIIRAVAKHSAENGFGTKVTNSNASATYWKRGEDIVAYGSSYDFYQWNGAANITYGTDAVENKPLVVLDSTSVDGAYMIEYDKGNATEIVEAGILFGSDDDIVIGSTDGSKAVSQRKDNHGQFCAKPNAESSCAYVRGYLIYRAENKLYVIYTNAIEINQ